MFEKPISLAKAKAMSREQQQQLISLIEKAAYDNEVLYWGCSQAVLGAMQKYLNIGCGHVFKAASALAGGVGGTHEACGALTGGVMAISSAYGRSEFKAGKINREQPEFLEAQARAKRFCERFREAFQSYRCGDIRFLVRGKDCDRHSFFESIEAFENHAKCGEVTRLAARLAAEVILQPREPFAAEINATLAEAARFRERQRKSVK